MTAEKRKKDEEKKRIEGERREKQGAEKVWRLGGSWLKADK